MLTGGCVLNIQNVCNSICDDHSDKSDLVKDACNDERLLYTMKNTLKKDGLIRQCLATLKAFIIKLKTIKDN